MFFVLCKDFFYDFDVHYRRYADDKGVLWSFPFVRPSDIGLRFRITKPDDFKEKKMGIHYVMKFETETGRTGMPTTLEAFPKLFRWEDGAYQLNGEVLEHYHEWNKAKAVSSCPEAIPALDLDAHQAQAESFESSPKKARRSVNVGSAADEDALNI